MAELKIGELARHANLPSSTLRYYERIGLLPRARRVSGRRVYEPEILERLTVIKNAQDLGFTLEDIKLLLTTFDSGEEPSALCQVLAERKLRELDDLMAKAKAVKQALTHGLTCRCSSLNDCYVTSED